MSLPPSPSPDALPIVLQRDELFWVVVAAGFSLILVYLASAQPWRRWRPMRAASLIAQASRMRVSNHHVFFTVAGLLLAILCLSSLTVIEPGHRGVVFHLFEGVQSETLTEGVHFLLTGLNRVTVYDTRSRVYHVRNRAASPPPSPHRARRANRKITCCGRRRRMVSRWVLTSVTIASIPAPARVASQRRPEFEAKLVHPIVWNVIRLVASEYSLLDIYGKRRHEMQQQAFRRVQALFARDGLIGEDLLLRDVVYTPEFEKPWSRKWWRSRRSRSRPMRWNRPSYVPRWKSSRPRARRKPLELVNRAIRTNPYCCTISGSKVCRSGSGWWSSQPLGEAGAQDEGPSRNGSASYGAS